MCGPVQGPPSNYAYFTACLKRNLRVAVSLDHSNEAFSRQLEQNPALLSCCSMLWWQGWSDSSFTAMAASRLQVRWTVHVYNTDPQAAVAPLQHAPHMHMTGRLCAPLQRMTFNICVSCTRMLDALPLLFGEQKYSCPNHCLLHAGWWLLCRKCWSLWAARTRTGLSWSLTCWQFTSQLRHS